MISIDHKDSLPSTVKAIITKVNGSTHMDGNAAAATAKSLQSCPTLCNPRDGSRAGPLSLGFSRQEHWRGLPFPWEGDKSLVIFFFFSRNRANLENSHRVNKDAIYLEGCLVS